jgi:MFS family permease
MYSVLALLPNMAMTFGTSTQAVTWTSTGFGLAYAGGFLIVGPLVDRFGSRMIIAVGMAGTAFTTGLVAATTTLGSAIGLRVLQGIMAATLAPAAFSYMAARLRPEKRALGLTCFTSAALAAAVIMQVAAQVIAAALSWRAVFFSAAAVMVCLSAMSAFTLRFSKTSPTKPFGVAFAALPKLVTRPKLLALYTITVTLLGSFVAVYTAIALAGPSSVVGHPGALLALRGSALPMMIVVPLLTRWLQRIGGLVRISGGLGLAALAAVAMSFIGGAVAPLAVVLMVFVAGILIATPAMVEAVGAVAYGRGASIALCSFANFIGASLGSQLANVLVGQGFPIIVRVVAAITGVGALFALATRRTLGTCRH